MPVKFYILLQTGAVMDSTFSCFAFLSQGFKPVFKISANNILSFTTRAITAKQSLALA